MAACQADERVLAATLYGSFARGEADAFSDLDLGLITTDQVYDDFVASRAGGELLGNPVFLESFGRPDMLFFICADGTDGELSLGRVGQFNQDHGGPYVVLLDKANLLAGTVFPRPVPEPAMQNAMQHETLRRQIYWFWHDLSHFITAMRRGQLWWAYGELEILRGVCVNLARLAYNFADTDGGGTEPYFKIEQVMPTERLAALKATFCPLEPAAMRQAGLSIFRFYCDLAPALAQAHEITYPADLEHVMSARLVAMASLG